VSAGAPAWAVLRGVLFDVDGTLYDQRRLRAHMAAEWARYALRHGRGALEVGRSIVAFRRTREELRALGRPQARLEELQYARAALSAGADEGRLRAIVEDWIFTRPLPYLRRCRRPGVAELLHALAARGLAVGVFSDYPGHAKVEALGLSGLVSLTVCATDDAVNAFKPHPGGFAHACGRWSLRPEEVLYVGDRAEVDEAGAAAVGMPCVILGRQGASIQALRRSLGG
jgi:phosphoglycolate phosphatase/putative hydrolase of the HAD superfamily